MEWVKRGCRGKLRRLGARRVGYLVATSARMASGQTLALLQSDWVHFMEDQILSLLYIRLI